MHVYFGALFKAFLNILAVLPLVYLFGCARSAPELPYSRVGKSDDNIQAALGIKAADLELSCQQLAEELNAIKVETDRNESVIKGDRVKNQVAGYFGALFLIPLVGTDNNDAAKENLEKLQVRKDQVFYLKDRKNCA